LRGILGNGLPIHRACGPYSPGAALQSSSHPSP
jgi:hypothetical protein